MNKIKEKKLALNHFKKDLLNLPNMLTVLRIAFVPFVLWLVYADTYYTRTIAWIVYTIATLTDYFDGYLARKRGEVTITGKLLDPLADKFIVLLTLIVLLSNQEVSLIPVLLIFARELYIFGIRNIAIENKLIIAAGIGGKIKTFMQMFAIPFYIMKESYWLNLTTMNWPNKLIGDLLIWGSIIAAYYSAYIYSMRLKKELFKNS